MQETAPKPQPELTAKPPEGTGEFASLEASVAPDGGSVINGVDATGARSELLRTSSSEESNKGSLPEDLNQYSRLDAMVAKDGSRRVYGVDADTGKKSQLKGDDVLDAYGYSPDEAKDNKPKDSKEDGAKGEINVRPVKEGELTETISDSDKDDGVTDEALASMGHEPWTLDEEKEDKEPKDPGGPKDPPSGGGPGDPPNGGGEGGDPDEEEPGPEDPPGSGPNEGGPEDDPRKRIGEVVKDRIDELKEEGSSESDAHAEAHDEFWGRETSEEEPPIPTPEIPISPELEQAMAKLDDARTEYARMRAGRDGATFFSFRFSDKKVEAAKQAYEEAKAEAGSIAVDLLREHGLESSDMVSSINWGSLEEEFKLIDEQYDQEKEAVEGKRLKWFYDKWKKWSEDGFFSKGTLKKALVMAPVGVGVSIIAAPVLAGAGVAAAGGAGVGAVVAKSASRGMIGNRIRKNAGAAEMTETKAEERKAQATALIDALEEHKETIAAELESSEELKAYGRGMDSDLGELQMAQTGDQKRQNDKDARRDMIIGAGSALLGYAIAEGVSGLWPGGDTPDVPGPPRPSNFDLNESLYKGITMEPGASGKFANLIEYAQANGIGPDSAVANSFKKAAETLTDSQKDALGTALGRLSATPNYGNAWSIDHMNELAKMASEGQSASDILSNLFK